MIHLYFYYFYHCNIVCTPLSPLPGRQNTRPSQNSSKPPTMTLYPRSVQWTVTRISLDRFAMWFPKENRSRLFTVTVYDLEWAQYICIYDMIWVWYGVIFVSAPLRLPLPPQANHIKSLRSERQNLTTELERSQNEVGGIFCDRDRSWPIFSMISLENWSD